MNRLGRELGLLGSLLALSACQLALPFSPITQNAKTTTGGGTSMSGKALAQGACGGCHGVDQNGLSANPMAPEFATIANRRGLTRASLTTWLRGAHNYPVDMDFFLEDDEVGQLVRYIMTLRDDAPESSIE